MWCCGGRAAAPAAGGARSGAGRDARSERSARSGAGPAATGGRRRPFTAIYGTICQRRRALIGRASRARGGGGGVRDGGRREGGCVWCVRGGGVATSGAIEISRCQIDNVNDALTSTTTQSRFLNCCLCLVIKAPLEETTRSSVFSVIFFLGWCFFVFFWLPLFPPLGPAVPYLGHAPVPTSPYLLRAPLPGPADFNHLIFFDSCFPEKCIFNDLPLGLKAQQKHFDVHLKLHLFSGAIDFNNQPISPSFRPVRFLKIGIFKGVGLMLLPLDNV